MQKNKRILIISYRFAPENDMGAIRPTKLSKYLKKSGYDVDVIAVKNHLADDARLLDDIRGIQVARIGSGKAPQRKNGISGAAIAKPRKSAEGGGLRNCGLVRDYLRPLYYYFSVQYKNFLLFKAYYAGNRERFKEYSVVFSTYGPMFALLCGAYLKRKNPDVNWICDFRDPMVWDTTPPLTALRRKRLQNKACRLANSVTAVSKGYLRRIVKDKYCHKAFVITNGFDEEDMAGLKTVELDSAFSLVYAGVLYEGRRDLSPVFEAIQSLIGEKIAEKSDFVFHYAGGDFSELAAQAEKFGLQGILVNHGRISREECLRLQRRSRFLVLATWNDAGEEGVFPGKFLEYMLIDRPVISVVNGRLPDSEVTGVMDEGRFGVSYEAARRGEDRDRLREYLKDQYIRYKKGLSADFAPNPEVRDRYHYKNLVRQIEELF